MWKGKISPRLNAVVFISLCILTTIVCLTFAAEPYNGYLFDFRHIVLTLSTITGGPVAGGIVLIVMNAYRFWIGGDGAVLGLACSAAVYVSLVLSYPVLQLSSFRKKIALSTVISLIFVLWTPIFLENAVNPYEYSIYVLVYVMCTIVGMCLILYLVEILTLQAKLQEEMLHVEKFQLIGEMAASISHEIRNPLTSTRGFLQLLQSDACSAEERALYLNTAISGIDQANHVITDYLTFAKPSVETKQILHVEAELENIINLILPLANFSNIIITYQNQCDHPVYIAGERQKLQQCLLNIAKNCIEAMPNGGTLKLELKEENDAIQIIIRDTGIGMTQKQLDRLGSPFYSTKEKGTGLGMMVVFSVIKVMDGSIHISSQPNEGTKFSLSFPSENKK